MANPPLPKEVNQWSDQMYDILEGSGVNMVGNGVIIDSVVENAAETAITTIVSGIDPAEVIKLETVTNLLIAFYLAIPSVGRVAAAKLFSNKLKSILGPQLAGSTAVLALLEGIDQANPAVTALLATQSLKPEDFRQEILTKASGTVDNFKAWLTGVAPQIAAAVQTATAAITGHGQPPATMTTTQPPPIVSITMNPNLLLLATLRQDHKNLPELLAALENGALLEKKEDPTGPRPWLGQAAAFLKGLDILTSTEDGRHIIREEMLLLDTKLDSVFPRIPTSQLQATPLAYAPEFISMVVKLGRHNTQLPFVRDIPAGWIDTADQFVEIEGVLKSLRQLFGKEKANVILDANGNEIAQPMSSLELGVTTLKWSTITFLIGLPAVSFLGICWFIMSAISICWVASQQTTYALSAEQAETLAVSGTAMVVGLVIIVVTRLFFPFFDGPFNLLAKLLHKVGLRQSEAPIAPAFRNSNLISIIASGLTVLFLVVAGLAYIGGGSPALVLLAFCGIGALAAWGETMKRFHNSQWSDHGTEAHSKDGHHQSGEERKLIDAEDRFRWGIKMFNGLMFVFFGLIIPVGLATAGSRYYQDQANQATVAAEQARIDAQAAEDAAEANRRVACTEATATLTKWASVWNVADEHPEDGSLFSRMCELDPQNKIRALCAKQSSLCR